MNDTAKDLAYMKDPFMWITWCVPLKRRSITGYGPPDTAYLASAEPVIRHGNMWAPSPDDREQRYESHEAILADGWRVD